jgi:HSP20 family protein
MQPIEQALKEIRMLHEQLTRTPAPEIGPHSFLPFPAGQDPVAYAIDEVSRLKKLIEQTQAARQNEQAVAQWVPRASVFAGESSVSFSVELPGVAKEDVSVTVASGELVIRGHRNPATTDGGLQPVMVEQPWGAFERRFALPTWAASDQITARCALGVLEIVLTRGSDATTGEFRVEIG